MSHVATKWAFDQPELHKDMPPAEWAVLVVLADCHNPANGCFPSQEYICSRINLSDRAVRGHLARLRERGLIDWDPPEQRGVVGKWNRYRLGFEPGFVPAAADLQPADSAGWPTGNLEHAQPAESDTSNRQDSTSPIEEPVKGEPVKEPERERARDPEQAQPAPSGLSVDEAWAALAKVWPAFAAQSEARARPALSDLTPVERKLAVERVPAFLVFHRETQGNAKLPYLHNYLSEKHRWLALPQAKAAAVASLERKIVGAFDRAWSWLLFDAIRQLGDRLRDRRSAESRQLRDHIELARQGIGWPIAAGRIEEIELAAKSFVQVAVDGAEWDAWVAAMKARGVDLPRPDKARVFWVPTQWPQDEREWDQALREAGEIMGVER